MQTSRKSEFGIIKAFRAAQKQKYRLKAVSLKPNFSTKKLHSHDFPDTPITCLSVFGSTSFSMSNYDFDPEICSEIFLRILNRPFGRRSIAFM